MRVSSSTSAACSCSTASAARAAALAAPEVREGDERPDDGVGEVFPLADAGAFSTFSIAFAAVTLAPASADADGVSFFGSSFFAGAGVPIERTFAFGFGASPPMLKTFGASPPMLKTFGAPSFTATGLFRSAEPSAGLFAIVGVCRGDCDDWAAACGC